MSIRGLVTVALAFLLLPPVDRTASAQEAEAGGEVTVQRVWVGMEPDFYAGHPSPDGRYVSDIHWVSGDLAVIDLVSGNLERVGAKDGGWGETSWAECSVFSPDGRRIAYVWWTVGTEDDPDYNGYSIHTIELDGGEPEVLVPTGVGGYYLLDEWSADGRYILGKVYGRAGAATGAEEQLVRIRVRDGEIETLWHVRTGDFWRGPDKAAFSPDGSHVAFDILPGPDDHDLYVIPTTGGDPRPVLEGQADDRLLGWLPDGSGLLFYSDRNATSAIWFLPLDSESRPGEPRLLKADVWRVQALGFSRDAYLYGVVVESPQVYTGAIDVTNGGYLAPVGPVQEASHGLSLSGEFSPDGRYLAYATRSPDGTFAKNHAIVVRAVGGDDLRVFDAGRQRIPIGWTPDSKAVLLHAVDPDGGNQWRLERLDLATGQFTPVGPAIGRLAVISPDGRFGYRGRAEGQDRTSILEIDLSDGSERTVVESRFLSGYSVSPDGQTLAVAELDLVAQEHRVFTVPVSGGEPNVLYRRSSGETLAERLSFRSGLPWTPDGRHVLVVDGRSIIRIPVAGGEPKKLADLPVDGGYRHFRLHPDGSRFVINAGESKGEIWMVRGLPGMPVGPSTSDR